MRSRGTGRGASGRGAAGASTRRRDRRLNCRLEIALLHYSAPPVVGGVERIIGRHAQLLADAGHSVRVVAGRGSSPDPRVRFVEVPLADSLHPEVVAVGEQLAAGTVPPEFAALVERLRAELSAALAGSDVVIAHNVASLNRNLALTVALHDLLAGGGAAGGGQGAAPWRLILWHHDLAWTMPAYRSGLHDGDPWSLLRTKWPGAIDVTISEARRAELARLTGADPATIAVIPGGVDLPAAPELNSELGALLDSDPLLLAPVRVTARKNLELAVRVVAELRSRGRNAGLVVTGPVDPHNHAEKAYRARLGELIDRLGVGPSVVFLAERAGGPAPDETIAALYRLVDALFLPSTDEGFGLPILEAAAARLPIACSDLPSLRALAGDAATYFNPGAAPDDVADLLLDRLDRDQSAALARRIRREYAWPAIYSRSIAPLLARATA